MSLGMHIGIPRNAASVWSPLLLPNLIGWYDVSQSAGVVSSGGTISQLTDLSGNARHIVQATSAKRPALTTAGQNGLDVATFDGVDDCMAVAWAGNQPFSFAAAFKIRSNTPPSSGVIIGFGPWLGFDVEYYMTAGDRTMAKIAAGFTLPNMDISNGLFNSIMAVFNVASSAQYKNGVEQTGSIGGFATTSISIGDSPDEGSSNPTLTFGELVVIGSVFTSADRSLVDAYLRSKWGI